MGLPLEYLCRSHAWGREFVRTAAPDRGDGGGEGLLSLGRDVEVVQGSGLGLVLIRGLDQYWATLVPSTRSECPRASPAVMTETPRMMAFSSSILIQSLGDRGAYYSRRGELSDALEVRVARVSARGKAPIAFVLSVAASLLIVVPAIAAEVSPAELAAARELMRERRMPEAQAAYERLATVDPKNFEIQVQLGELALRRDQPETAVTLREGRKTRSEVGARAKAARGCARYGGGEASMLSKFGHAKKTLAAYERAVVLDPAYVEGRLALFEYYRQAPGMAGGGFDKAAAQAAKIKELDAARGRIAFATLYVGEKKFDEALAQFDEVLAANPDDYVAHFQIGRLAAMTGQFAERGLASLRRCLELTPSPGSAPHAAVQWRIGNILEKKNEAAAARAAYEAALARSEFCLRGRVPP